MSNLKTSLRMLCNNQDILGGIIITKDGMLIESYAVENPMAETLGALMSNVALVIKTSLQDLGHQEFNRYVIQSNKGRIYLVDLGKAVLIALTDLNIELGKVNMALFQAANEIKKSGRIDI
ncbi:MAG: roadblock/LC7 domain-containing protein [Nitrospinota bacterium]|nr:roadblock/LC7 domain-containing protein [Nitrospinota bacterium]